MKIIFLSELVRSEYTVNVASQSTLVNPGDNYMAYCNIPGLGPLDIISDLEVKWFHNAQELTRMCAFQTSDLAQKYDCNIFSLQQNNITLKLTVKSKSVDLKLL